MFILYDENMQEIQYPEGLLPLDIFVSSLQKRVETETVPGVPGHILYGATHQQRTVELTMWLKSKDSTDYRLLRNEIYALFDTGRYMYVAEKNVPSRVLKILIENAYTPSRLTSTVAEVTISARTLDEVYWQSRYTTLELHDSGYDAIAEKYGLIDNIDDEKVKYRFTESDFTVYNAGNVTVRPENMNLEITATGVSGDNFKIRNITSGDEVVINKSLSNRTIRISNLVTENDLNIFRNTNKRLINLVHGDNEFEVEGVFNQISVDFKYYYK